MYNQAEDLIKEMIKSLKNGPVIKDPPFFYLWKMDEQSSRSARFFTSLLVFMN